MTTESIRLTRVQRFASLQRSGLLRSSVWGLADQALISVTNFVTMVLVARTLSPAAFGAFALMYSGLLLANTLQSSLITQPLSVLSASRRGREAVRYTTTTAASQVCLATIAALLALGAAVVAHVAAWGGARLLIALVPAIFAWQLQEFVRRVLYTEDRMGTVFANDVISYGGQTLAIAALWRLDRLSGPAAFYALAATSAVAAGIGGWQLRQRLGGSVDRAALSENWQFGKWLTGAELFHWLSSPQMYQYLAAVILGTAATGTLKATEIVFGPTRALTFYLITVLPIRFSRTLVLGGEQGLHSQLKLTYAVIAPLLGGYCLFVAILAEPLLRLLYGANYAGGGTVLMLYAVYSFLVNQVQIVSSALKAKRLTRPIFMTYVYTSAIALSAGWLFILLFGISGALIGMIFTSIVATLCLWRIYRHSFSGSLTPSSAE